jgi:chitin synthase
MDEKPAAKTKNADGSETFEVDDEIATEQDDVDKAWSRYEKQMLVNKNEVVQKSKRDEKTKNEDKTKEFRTKFLLLWIFCNALLVVLFTNEFTVSKLFRGNSSTVILGVIFWSVAVLSTVRFIGSCVYLGQWWVEKIEDAGQARGNQNPV